MIQINFANDEHTKGFILSLFSKLIDGEGFIIERDSRKRVLSSDGDEIKIDEFGGVTNGSEIYLKNNVVSLINFYRQHSGGRA
jgi:hypothetical protein